MVLLRVTPGISMACLCLLRVSTAGASPLGDAPLPIVQTAQPGAGITEETMHAMDVPATKGASCAMVQTGVQTLPCTPAIIYGTAKL